MKWSVALCHSIPWMVRPWRMDAPYYAQTGGRVRRRHPQAFSPMTTFPAVLHACPIEWGDSSTRFLDPADQIANTLADLSPIGWSVSSEDYEDVLTLAFVNNDGTASYVSTTTGETMLVAPQGASFKEV